MTKTLKQFCEAEILKAQLKFIDSKKCKLPKWAKNIAKRGIVEELSTRRLHLAGETLT